MSILTWRVLGMAGVLCVVGLGCAQQEPVSHYVIMPLGGQTETSAPDIAKLTTTLDAFAAHHGMPKYKAGEVGIISYYRSTEDYEIAFYAKRDGVYLRVYTMPMTPSVARLDSFAEFRQNLANVLSQAFPGRVTMAK